ncbi:pantoate--beta-alanine ligase [Arcobacter sp. 15-2]|uniref:pantoate--beta-alanine ligase n=1 Tax=Arcobacter sp. 15-2 TaxID=3374109 RepID=UPI00399C69E5
MKIINNIQELKLQLQQENKTIGLVPTMGSLHEGHISLIKKARKENEVVVVSIFVNPTQFLANEDLDKYPRKDESDKKICALCEVDYLFMPNINTMYSQDEVLIKAPKINSFILEGEKRPGHFDGVLQIVLKLFNIVNPTNAYFGKKDAQQLSLVMQMVENFYMDVTIVPCEIVRESDGLALSSRNVYLSHDEKAEALKVSQSLNLASKLVVNLELNCSTIIENMKTALSSEKIEIEYVSIVNRKFQTIETIELKNSIILVAVKIGTTRLIDNIWI